MKPRILLWDIETTPNIGYCWGRWEQNIIEFVEESRLLSIAWKWEGEKKVNCLTTANMSEKSLCQEFSKVLDQAHVSIAHNGNAFDVKKFNARLIYNRLKRSGPLMTIDTKSEAKKYFMFNSNSLNDLGKFLKVGRKYKHSGFELWLKCMKGNKKAYGEMAKYNKKDVELLERVYKRMKPFMVKNTVLKKLKKMESL